MSSPAKATSRGPDCPVGTPGGRAAHVVSPQQGQASRCRWYSITWGLIWGSSHTWWRSGAASSPDSSRAQRRLEGDDLVALSRREERALLPGVAGLTTRTTGRRGLGSWRLGVGGVRYWEAARSS